MLTKTAMLEARHLTGDRELYQRFRAQFRSHCVQGHEKEYIAARMEDQARRHEKFANNVYLQEPNVKRGCGGLRDYQNLLWITYFKEGALTTTHLVGKDWLSASDRRRIDRRLRFSPPGADATALHERARHGRAAPQPASGNRAQARLQPENAGRPERGVHEGLLRAHAKYFSDHGTADGTLRDRHGHDHPPAFLPAPAAAPARGKSISRISSAAAGNCT